MNGEASWPKERTQSDMAALPWYRLGRVGATLRRFSPASLAVYRRLTFFTAFAVWGLIVLGGSVRVTNSGTGCGSSWPMCHGRLLPSLEYHELVEWNHRLFATLVGLLMAVTVLSTLIWHRRPRRLPALALIAAATYIGQALLGGITVLLHLDHTWVAAHMGNSMLLLGSVVLLALFARESNFPARPTTRGGKLHSMTRYLVLAALGWTYLAMLTGSAVVGSEADLACPAWPQCASGHLLPLSGAEWINFGHRLAVGLSDLLMLALAFAIWRTRRDDHRTVKAARALAFLYVSQVFLGAFTIWLGAPEALKGAHLALAAATWAGLVVLAARVWSPGLAPASTVGGEPSDSAPPRRRRPSFAARHVPEVAQRYFSLVKPRVIPLLLVPTVASMVMAAVQHPPGRPLISLVLFTVLGGTLAAGGAHSINQYYDRDIDALMRRTRRRPVVTGQVAPRGALLFGVALSALAFIELWVLVNPVAALLAVAGNLFYVFVYTLWLKRTSPQNIVIGGAAGAVPPLVGWAAVSGGLDVPALLFFAIIFFWTPAHFWALALVRQEDYRAAGIPMLPVVRGEAYTRKQILVYTALLVAVSVVPFITRSLGPAYLAVALGLGLVFLVRSARLAGEPRTSTARAWGLFKFSNIYLALLYLAMVVDRLLALGGVRVL